MAYVDPKSLSVCVSPRPTEPAHPLTYPPPADGCHLGEGEVDAAGRPGAPE